MTLVNDESGNSATVGSAPYVALRDQHRALLRARQHKPSDKELSVPDEEIRRFIASAQAAGAYIGDEDERYRVQSFLDYWSAQLISTSEALDADFMPPVLAPLQEGGVDPLGDQIVFNKAHGVDWQARKQVRLAAAARLWQDSGGTPGYLLSDQALKEAANYRHDPDIAELVRASEVAADRRSHWQLFAAVCVAVLLLAIAVFCFLQWQGAEQAASEAVRAASAAETAKTTAEAATGSALARVAELESTSRRLDLALQVIRKGVGSGHIGEGDVPNELMPLLEATRTPKQSFTLKASENLAGFETAFLGTQVPLPELSEGARANSFENGRRIDYVNYSLVLDAARRIAVFSASNVDRRGLRVLPRVSDLFDIDPRVPAELQPEATWFVDANLDRGHLVTRQEIAWGPYFEGPALEAAGKAAAMVNVYTNVTPQFAPFNRSLWAQLERYSLTEFNGSSRRVNIFSGPVLRADDPIVGKVPMPRHYWKVMVSERTVEGGELMAEAYLAPNVEHTANTLSGAAKADLKIYQTTVAKIEDLTGLNFGDVVRTADVLAAPIASRATTGWINIGAAVGNPCPEGYGRGAELRKDFRVSNRVLLPVPQTKSTFACTKRP